MATFLGVDYLSKSYTIQVLDNEIRSAQQQAKDIATMTEGAFQSQIPKDSIASSINTALKNSDEEIAFISVFDWSEKIIAHPDHTLIGDKQAQTESEGLKLDFGIAPNAQELYDFVDSLGEVKQGQSEIFYIANIKTSDWIISAHLNIANIKTFTQSWKNEAYLVFLTFALIIILIVMGTIRMITSYYEGQLRLKSSQLEDGVLNLSKLNDSLENYQNKLGELTSLQTTEATSPVETTKEKQRILTYVRNELMPVATEDIGYIYVENTITYVVQKDGKRSTTSESLDQIYSYLDEGSFFRANRQIIVAISAIDKIIKFGNSKLKIQVTPASEIDIIIGKNKAAAFKQWLDL
jgi:DNA-binding LytR/AlgR family response regulator